MPIRNCNCSGFNPECNKCGGRGYYEVVEETIANSFKSQLKEIYSTYPTVRFQYIKDILLLEDTDENIVFFKDGLEFYKKEKNNILKISKYAEYISSQHLFVSICEDYFANVEKVMQLIIDKEALDEAKRLELLEAEKIKKSQPSYPIYITSKQKREKQKRINEKKEALNKLNKLKLEKKNNTKKKSSEVKKKLSLIKLILQIKQPLRMIHLPLN